ncbi:MAG: hypothetical protein BWY46_01183 [Firmicutes bacterium ADurb.Bin300]|nr:MAG: hypothetical protein BWY46_01183 [Firmicutes bacterium ADurb.Bin300]
MMSIMITEAFDNSHKKGREKKLAVFITRYCPGLYVCV